MSPSRTAVVLPIRVGRVGLKVKLFGRGFLRSGDSRSEEKSGYETTSLSQSSSAEKEGWGLLYSQKRGKDRSDDGSVLSALGPSINTSVGRR